MTRNQKKSEKHLTHESVSHRDEDYTTLTNSDKAVSEIIYGYIPFVILVFKNSSLVDTIYTNCPKDNFDEELESLASKYDSGHEFCIYPCSERYESKTLLCKDNKFTF